MTDCFALPLRINYQLLFVVAHNVGYWIY